MIDTTTLDCGHAPSAHGTYSTCYGTTPDGRRHCYECCSAKERADMVERGKACLYLVKGDSGYEITDWPGTLRFRARHVRKGRHNIARVRYDAWFFGPDGFVWHGASYGDMTQLIHCKRTKERA